MFYLESHCPHCGEDIWHPFKKKDIFIMECPGCETALVVHASSTDPWVETREALASNNYLSEEIKEVVENG